jgi:fructose-bisphosphate aldolase, class II
MSSGVVAGQGYLGYPRFNNYDGVLKVAGEAGSKKTCDSRRHLGLAKSGMAERLKQAVTKLRAAGTTCSKG